jgi:two-component system nitrogen regulation response regulator NtrX
VDLLIVDDEGNIRRMLRALLESEGYTVRDVPSAEAALTEVTRTAPDVVLLDLALPGRSGLEALPDLMAGAPGAPVIMMSGRATLSDAVQATRLGAFHFLEKPLTPEAVLVTVRGATEVARARNLTRALQEELGPGAELIGQTPEMAKVRSLIRRVARTDARVLITGESGTGKELAAAAIHGLSRRQDGPFLRVNSAAIPSDLVETEMFGHEKGAFTGATERRRGRLEIADGGTLFLDEVADLSPDAQSKLLRALENGVIERIGGTTPISVDVRIIAATHRDLRREVQAGRFREDLFFRLDVVPIHLPPLRDRRADIPLLVEHYLDRLGTRHGLPSPIIREDGMARMMEHTWPGNVRELFNIIERLAILHPGGRVGPEEVTEVLPLSADGDVPSARPEEDRRSLRERLDDYERELLDGALEASDGNVAEAGRRLKTDRANLYRRMKRLGMSDA